MVFLNFKNYSCCIWYLKIWQENMYSSPSQSNKTYSTTARNTVTAWTPLWEYFHSTDSLGNCACNCLRFTFHSTEVLSILPIYSPWFCNLEKVIPRPFNLLTSQSLKEWIPLKNVRGRQHRFLGAKSNWWKLVADPF